MKHTPGPWYGKVFENGAYIIADGPVDDLSSCVIASRNAHPDPATGKANGRLIKAAPELLEALRAIVKHQDVAGGPLAKLSTTRVIAARAIAKATGEEI